MVCDDAFRTVSNSDFSEEWVPRVTQAAAEEQGKLQTGKRARRKTRSDKCHGGGNTERIKPPFI